MGSWAELDATYPPGALTPATALVVALGHLAGASSAYANQADRTPAAFLAPNIASRLADYEVLSRADRYLREVELSQFLKEARALLKPQQTLCLVLNLLDAVLERGVNRPEDFAVFGRIVDGLGVPIDELRTFWQVLLIKNDLTVFPQ